MPEDSGDVSLIGVTSLSLSKPLVHSGGIILILASNRADVYSIDVIYAFRLPPTAPVYARTLPPSHLGFNMRTYHVSLEGTLSVSDGTLALSDYFSLPDGVYAPVIPDDPFVGVTDLSEGSGVLEIVNSYGTVTAYDVSVDDGRISCSYAEGSRAFYSGGEILVNLTVTVPSQAPRSPKVAISMPLSRGKGVSIN